MNSDRYLRRRELMEALGQTGGLGKVYGSPEGELSSAVSPEGMDEALRMLQAALDDPSEGTDHGQ